MFFSAVIKMIYCLYFWAKNEVVNIAIGTERFIINRISELFTSDVLLGQGNKKKM